MNPEPQISHRTIAKLVAAAVIIDAIEIGLMFIPIIGWIIILGIDVIAWIFFYVWFKRLGVNFNSFKRFLYFNSGLILDLIPFVNSFAWTVDILMVVSTLKKEELQEKFQNISRS